MPRSKAPPHPTAKPAAQGSTSTLKPSLQASSKHPVPKCCRLGQPGCDTKRHAKCCMLSSPTATTFRQPAGYHDHHDAAMLDATDGTPSCIDTCCLTRPRTGAQLHARRVAAHTPLQMTRDAAMTARTLSRGHSVGGTGDKGPRNTPALHARAHANPSAASCQLQTHQH